MQPIQSNVRLHQERAPMQPAWAGAAAPLSGAQGSSRQETHRPSTTSASSKSLQLSGATAAGENMVAA